MGLTVTQLEHYEKACPALLMAVYILQMHSTSGIPLWHQLSALRQRGIHTHTRPLYGHSLEVAYALLAKQQTASSNRTDSYTFCIPTEIVPPIGKERLATSGDGLSCSQLKHRTGSLCQRGTAGY